MVFPVDQPHLHVHHGITGDQALRNRSHHALFNGRNELPRNHPTHDGVFEYETAASRQRLKIDVADPELPVTSGLLFLFTLHVGHLSSDRLSVRNPRRTQLAIIPLRRRRRSSAISSCIAPSPDMISSRLSSWCENARPGSSSTSRWSATATFSSKPLAV